MSERILVVDDEDSLRLSLKMRLQTAGFQVETAGDGEEALDKLKDNTYDVVLLDIKMPRLDGIEALPLILQAYPQTEVIMMTGFSDFSTAVECLKAGARDFLVKPIETTELITRLKALLRTRASEKALQQVQQHYSSMLLYDMYGPLNTISEVINKAIRLTGKDTPKHHAELLSYASKLSDEVSSKIRSMIDFAEIEKATLELHSKKLDFGNLAHSACTRHEILARELDIALKPSLEPSLPSVVCDAAKIEQVMNYVLSTVIRHSTKGATVTVSVSRSSKESKSKAKDSILFSAASDNSKIHDEDLDMMFHKNGQQMNTKAADLQQTVLSLALSKRIIEAHGGLFWIGPKTGKGIQYNFMIPLAS